MRWLSFPTNPASEAAFAWGGEVKFKEAGAAGAEATLAFEGTGVAIVGRCTQEGGRADVFLDSEKAGEIDAWIPKNTSDDDYWHVSGLRAGKHSVRIVARTDTDSRSTGTKASDSAGHRLWHSHSPMTPPVFSGRQASIFHTVDLAVMKRSEPPGIGILALASA